MSVKSRVFMYERETMDGGVKQLTYSFIDGLFGDWGLGIGVRDWGSGIRD
jgi:hypothetical protein